MSIWFYESPGVKYKHIKIVSKIPPTIHEIPCSSFRGLALTFCSSLNSILHSKKLMESEYPQTL